MSISFYAYLVPVLKAGKVRSLFSVTVLGSVYYTYDIATKNKNKKNLETTSNLSLWRRARSSYENLRDQYLFQILSFWNSVYPQLALQSSSSQALIPSTTYRISGNGPSLVASSPTQVPVPQLPTSPLVSANIQLSPSSPLTPLPLPSAPTIVPVPMGIFASAIISCFASCAAESTTYPFDFAKTRLQIQSEIIKDGKSIHSASIVSRFNGMFDVLQRVRYESPNGIYAVYSGLRPALLRQATYGTLKVVIYERMKHILEHDTGMTSPVQRQIVAGAMAGALSSAICNPTDLIKVRMAGGDRAEYTSIWKAFRSIIKDEGVFALYKGVGPTTQRAMVVTLLNLPTYDMAKAFILERSQKESIATHFWASIIAGIISTIGSNPIDTVKSRIMNQPVDEMGRGMLYRNSVDCAVKTLRDEGVLALWKGTVPNCCRNVPWLIVFWCSYEALKGVVQKIEK